MVVIHACASRAIEPSSGRESDRANDRAIERSSDRAIERPSDRAIERSTERSSDRATERSTDRSSDRSIGQWPSVVDKRDEKVDKGGEKVAPEEKKTKTRGLVATIQKQKTKRGSSKIVFIIGHPRPWMVESLWAFWFIYVQNLRNC